MSTKYKENDKVRATWDCLNEKHTFSGIVKFRKNILMLYNKDADFWLDLSSKFLKNATFEVTKC